MVTTSTTIASPLTSPLHSWPRCPHAQTNHPKLNQDYRQRTRKGPRSDLSVKCLRNSIKRSTRSSNLSERAHITAPPAHCLTENDLPSAILHHAEVTRPVPNTMPCHPCHHSHHQPLPIHHNFHGSHHILSGPDHFHLLCLLDPQAKLGTEHALARTEMESIKRLILHNSERDSHREQGAVSPLVTIH